MDLRTLVKDKRAIGVVAVGALLGVITLVRRSASSTASGAASTTTQGTGYTTGALGSYSDGGLGAYNNIQTSMDNQLGQFRDQLSGVQDQLEGLKPAANSQSGGAATTPPATGTGSMGKAPVGKPVATVKPAATQQLAPGYGWFATGGQTYTVDAVAKRYNITTAALLALNPTLQGQKTIGKNTPVKVRSNAARWDLAAYRKVNSGK